jgi:hypothetical protein
MEKPQLYLLLIKTLSGMGFVPAERSKPVYFDRVLEPFRLAIGSQYGRTRIISVRPDELVEEKHPE